MVEVEDKRNLCFGGHGFYQRRDFVERHVRQIVLAEGYDRRLAEIPAGFDNSADGFVIINVERSHGVFATLGFGQQSVEIDKH